MDNAIDSTPESGRITLSAEVDQEHVALKVLDTGSGIPDYALSRIFERFYSLPRANGQKSSGLGLAFVSEVARLFNGEVTLRNVQEVACWPRFDFTVTSHSFKFFPHSLRILLPLQRRRLC
ncbi:ATP-binding protein [Escherichia coli]